MSTLSKRAAMELVANIRGANVRAHAHAARVVVDRSSTEMAFFLGGLEAVLGHFLQTQGCSEAAAALSRAINDAPTEAELRSRTADTAQPRGLTAGSAS